MKEGVHPYRKERRGVGVRIGGRVRVEFTTEEVLPKGLTDTTGGDVRKGG